MLSSIDSYWTSTIFVTRSNIQSLNINLIFKEKITWEGVEKYKISHSVTMDDTVVTVAPKKITLGIHIQLCISKNSNSFWEGSFHVKQVLGKNG